MAESRRCSHAKQPSRGWCADLPQASPVGHVPGVLSCELGRWPTLPQWSEAEGTPHLPLHAVQHLQDPVSPVTPLPEVGTASAPPPPPRPGGTRSLCTHPTHRCVCCAAPQTEHSVLLVPSGQRALRWRLARSRLARKEPCEPTVPLQRKNGAQPVFLPPGGQRFAAAACGLGKSHRDAPALPFRCRLWLCSCHRGPRGEWLRDTSR